VRHHHKTISKQRRERCCRVSISCKGGDDAQRDENPRERGDGWHGRGGRGHAAAAARARGAQKLAGARTNIRARAAREKAGRDTAARARAGAGARFSEGRFCVFAFLSLTPPPLSLG
jgi:hypothetical protein